ncbi:MAG: IS1595 family transposase [Bryobacteraceae bacterium]|nr:IS1595 family transposase [Bryobacteraceae bacterium]
MESARTLQEAIVYFSNPDNCQNFMIESRWVDGKVVCPRCGSANVTYLENARLYKCYGKHEKAKFSLKVGTIFEDSPIGLDKWFTALWLVVNCKNGISSYEISRDIGISQKSAWHMAYRIRFALHQQSFDKQLSGEIEVDETIGRATEELDKTEGKIKSDGNKGDAQRIGEVAAAGASVGASSGGLAGRAGMGVGIGAAAGLATVLLTRGPDTVLAKGTTLEMVLDRPLTFDESELDIPGGSRRGGPLIGEGSGQLPRQSQRSVPMVGRRMPL